jgi:hypothetical protein
MEKELSYINRIFEDEETDWSLSSPTLNRTYKDQIFRAIFKEKEQFLSLYNAVNGTEYDNPDDLTVTTVEQYVFMGMKNDVSYLVYLSLALYEHQSTDSPNIPIRFLLYFAQQLQDMIKPRQMYSAKRIELPNPQFVVFYNGKKKLPECSTVRLSDSFPQTDGEPQVELIANVLNINPGYNEELKKRCPILGEYMIFVEKVREYCKDIHVGSISDKEQKRAIGEAALRAVDWCIERHVLEEFLRENKRRVIIMSIFEFNDEIWEQIREDDRTIAHEDGLRQGRIDAIQKMLRKDFSKEVILDLGYSEEEYEKAEKELFAGV